MITGEKWRLVEEETPDEDCRVLAWAKGWFAPKIMWFCLVRDGIDDDFTCYWHNEESGYEPSDMPLIEEDGDILPTHWMPLPSPPLFNENFT